MTVRRTVPAPVPTYETSRLLAEVNLMLAMAGVKVHVDDRRLPAAHKAAAELLACLGVVGVSR